MFYDTIESQAEEMSCAQIEMDKAILSNELFEMAMRLTDIGCRNVDGLIRNLCESNQLSYPPQQITGSSAPANADNLAMEHL